MVDYCWELLVWHKGWSGAEFGAVFSTLGIASIIMPALTGIIADRWINAEKLYEYYIS
jgi:NHS family xanthosine MFS transporter